MFKQFIESFYVPTYNYVSTNVIGTNLYFGIFQILHCVFLLVILFSFFKSLRNDSLLIFEAHNILRHLNPAIICLMIVFISIQTASQFLFFSTEKHTRNPEIKQFAIFCRNHISGKQQADFITDINTQIDPGMYRQRLLAYLLYPIDIRDLRQGEKEYLIFFGKENASAHVPKDYIVLNQWDPKSLIAKRIIIGD